MEEVKAITLYGKVVENTHRAVNMINVDNGEGYQVVGGSLVERLKSSSKFDEVKKVTKTNLAEKLVGAGSLPFEVEFVKANGTPRVLVGRLVSSEHLLGRSMVEDLLLPNSESRIRQVDHRTLNYIIIDGVKYELK
jgi:hypothetical protein